MLLSTILRDHLDAHNHAYHGKSYPPYNIVKLNDENYAIELAVAGFQKDNFSVELLDGNLHIHGAKSTKDSGEYLHKGISSKSFSLKFKLASNVEIKQAKYEDGILRISLQKLVPEHQKPKTFYVD